MELFPLADCPLHIELRGEAGTLVEDVVHVAVNHPVVLEEERVKLGRISLIKVY